MSSMRVPSHADYQAQLGLPDKAVIDKEIGEVLTTREETARQALYRDILTRLHNDAVYLPISYISMMVVAKPELGTIPFAPIASEIPFDQLTPRHRKMSRYICKRLLLLIPMIFAASVVIFLLLRPRARAIRRWIICGCPTCRPRRR